MPRSLDKAALTNKIVVLLASAPDGLSAPEILSGLGARISQPSLSRLLTALRGQGRVVSTGKARATRYLYSGTRGDVAATQSRLLHQRIARRIARNPALVRRARQRLKKLSEVNPAGRRYHERWAELLDSELPILLRTLVADSEASDALRKESPFTILATQEDRNQVFRQR